MTNIKDIFQLDDCLNWIVENNFKKIALQLKLKDLKHSVEIVNYLQIKSLEKFGKSPSNDALDLYVSQSSTCCVDLLVTQHVSNLEAIIHFGNVCLSQPQIKNLQIKQPVLFAFGRQSMRDDKFLDNVEKILEEIESIKKAAANSRICVFYDTSLIDYANKLADIVINKNLSSYVEIANLHCPDPSWYTTPNNQACFMKNSDGGDLKRFGHYLLKESVRQYDCAIHLGNGQSIHLALEGPSNLLKFNCYENMALDKVNVPRLLNKRIALVSRLKDDEELRIGVIITNPLPDIASMMDRLDSYSKPRKHTLYFISMVQTIDECKIGNFDLCDAFIVINSCTCSTILESLVFNRPILTELEFKLACGFGAEYGRVLWPGSSPHAREEDVINKRKVSDVTMALTHTRNEMLERCSQARANKWSGLAYKATSGIGNDGLGGVDKVESLALEEGLKGIASSYASEPVKKSSHASEDDASDSKTNISMCCSHR